ncbi:hypothetical protein VTL71DRAFT_11530 [Oculimacula yallundae]|uniref:Uncharacterized protein n=1 Tax=Oculimacula yallundae TaxID=86028 RepID=A0ABR4CQB9_9HELO
MGWCINRIQDMADMVLEPAIVPPGKWHRWEGLGHCINIHQKPGAGNEGKALYGQGASQPRYLSDLDIAAPIFTQVQSRRTEVSITTIISPRSI